ncbi:hypothetical protein [Microbacterium sp.]
MSWTAIVLGVVMIVMGTPALLHRLRTRRTGETARHAGVPAEEDLGS